MTIVLYVYHKLSNLWDKLFTIIYMTVLNVVRKKSAIFMFNIPEHGNMGDQAIVLAEQEFFHQYFHNKIYIKISDIQWTLCREAIIKAIRKNDWICIHGGGYIGDLWPGAERIAREVIDAFPDKIVVLMPNTIYYKDESKEELKKRLKYYSERNTYLFLRDEESYHKAEIAGLQNISLVPDTVAFMRKDTSNQKRKGVLLCFRNDIEKALSDKEYAEIKKILKDRKISYEFIDTVDKHGVRFWNRRYKVERKLKQFTKASLVITDRLHGMYFCAITGTPCIALNNLSRKVQGGVKWLEGMPYIKCIEDPDSKKLNRFINEMLNYTHIFKYQQDQLFNFFETEAKLIAKINE